jgi:Mn-containing catalase
MPGKYKDLILDVGTEELAHVEMISIMIARLLEGAPAETTAKACTDNPVLAAVVGGMNPAQAIVSGGGPLLADSSGRPGAASTSSPAATCSPTSTPTPPPRCRASCRPPGCTT